MRLDQSQRLEELIQGAETSRHHDEALGIAGEDGLAGEEILEIDAFVPVYVRVAALLHREHDVQTHALSATSGCSFVAGFHDAGTAAGNDTESTLGKLVCDFLSHYVIFVIRAGTCGAENSHARANGRHFLIAVGEFAHYLENGPGIFCLGFAPILDLEAFTDPVLFFLSQHNCLILVFYT